MAGSPDEQKLPHQAWARVRTFARRYGERAWIYTRAGLIPVVWVLLAITAAAAVFGWVNRPDTTVPEPASGSIEVDFDPGHPALSPVTVEVTLSREDVSLGAKGGVIMTVDFTGADFGHTGWSIEAIVPSGVTVTGPGHYLSTDQGMSYVYIPPDPQSDGKFEADFQWSDLSSGPLQVIGATTTAALPRVEVVNQPATASEQVPSPPVTVNDVLAPGGDFTYQSGPEPAAFDGYDWRWKPAIGRVNDPDFAAVFSVEAKSAYLDGQDHVAEFYSGIAFGIAAAAATTGVVEFLKVKREAAGHAGDADDETDVAGDPPPPQDATPATLDADG